MEKLNEMTTLTEVLENLRINKMDNEFRWENGTLNAGRGKNYTPDELSIIKTYRFEGDSNPSDSSILYLFEATDGLMGYSLDAYGLYSNHDDEKGYDNFIRQIKVKNHDDQLAFKL